MDVLEMLGIHPVAQSPQPQAAPPRLIPAPRPVLYSPRERACVPIRPDPAAVPESAKLAMGLDALRLRLAPPELAIFDPEANERG